MGVRFACHACGKRLNIKSELAGRRGICPACSVRFRIPAHDTQTSTPIDASEAPDTDGSSASGSQRQRARNTPGVSTSSATAVASRSPAESRSSKQRSQPQQHGGESRQPSLEEILGGASATWYVRPSSGGQFGPADGPTLGQWITEGRVADSAMLWRDGWPEWRIARNVLQTQQGTEQSRGEPAAPRIQPPTPVTRTPAVANVPAVANIDEATASTTPAVDADAPLRTGGKVLDSNKKRVSRKRITISVVLALVFVMLLAALILVLLRT